MNKKQKHVYYIEYKEKIWDKCYKEHRQTKLDYAKNYRDHILNKNKHKKYMQEYYKKNRGHLLIKAYEQRKKLDKEEEREYQRNYYLEHKEQFNQQALRRYHINKDNEKLKHYARKRALKKYKNLPICQICKKVPATNRHHDDYTQPLKVIFCCEACHKNIHRKWLKEKGRKIGT